MNEELNESILESTVIIMGRYYKELDGANDALQYIEKLKTNNLIKIEYYNAEKDRLLKVKSEAESNIKERLTNLKNNSSIPANTDLICVYCGMEHNKRNSNGKLLAIEGIDFVFEEKDNEQYCICVSCQKECDEAGY